MKNLLIALIITASVWGCGKDNIINNNSSTDSDSSITLWKDSLLVFPFIPAIDKFGANGTDSINLSIKLQLKATWDGSNTSDTLLMALMRVDSSGQHILDSLYGYLPQKNYLYTFYLNTNNEYANQIWFSSVNYLFLYDIKAYKH